MYYIVNHTQHIIAADNSLLALLSVESIDELYTKIALDDIKFTPSNEDVTITTVNGTHSYHTQSHTLSGILGDITLIEIDDESIIFSNSIQEESEKEDDKISFDDEPFKLISDAEEVEEKEDDKISFDDEPFKLISDAEEVEEKEDDKISFDDEPFKLISDAEEVEEKEDDKISFDDEPFELISDAEEVEEKEESEKEDNKISLDDELLDLVSDTKKIDAEEDDKISFDDEPFKLISDAEEVEEKEDDKISFDDEPFELISDAEEVTAKETTTENIITTKDDTSPIVVNVENISQNIGISADDYNNFLNEYIDTALTLEKDLGSKEEKKRLNAIGTLYHLSNVLHLPMVTSIIEQIRSTSFDEQNTLIKSLYMTLARLTTTQTKIIKKATETTSVDIHEENIVEVVQDNIVETVEEKADIEENITTEGFGTIDLSDVKPIHFDFQLEAAANDLNLPVELIEEFVNDFIEQAHVETKKMLEYYEKGDLDTIQKIGHLLKGTASNLRINQLADTLYEIQFCEDSNNLEKLIKEYWAHFLSFETQINLISNKRK